ncbi:hypothetical protein PENSPDRAFT_692703 [Peniophora sp. CONT]|nr:hypothetical protein PENSPDRAFT_692703 [Peniophora sp. CONT]
MDFASVTGGFVERERLSFLHKFVEHAAPMITRSQITALVLEVDNNLFMTQCGFFKRKLDFVADTWEGQPIYGKTAEQDAYTPVIDLWFHQCVWDERTSLGDFFASIPSPLLATIDTADVDPDGLSTSDLELIFARLQHLHTLHLRAPDHGSLLALTPHTNHQHTTLLETGIVPSLRHLRLVNLHLCAIPDNRKGRPVCMHEVVEMVALRAGTGLPLQSLHIDGVHWEGTDQAAVDAFFVRLQEIVPDVKVIIYTRTPQQLVLSVPGNNITIACGT